MKSEYLMHIQFSPERSLQEQIREHLLDAMRNGVFEDKALPSCRKLASMLRVSRNTVVLVYDKLVDEGYLKSQERSGYYPNTEALHEDLNIDDTSTSRDEVILGAKPAHFGPTELRKICVINAIYPRPKTGKITLIRFCSDNLTTRYSL